MPDFVGFSSEELADLTGVEHSWILYQAMRGAIPHHRRGSDIWFTGADLEALGAPGRREPQRTPRGRGT